MTTKKEYLPNSPENIKLHHFFVFRDIDLKIGVCASLLMSLKVLGSDLISGPSKKASEYRFIGLLSPKSMY